MKKAPFTVLMSVYAKEKAEFLEASLSSLLTAHDPPTEVVLVEDGPLPQGLLQIIEHYRHQLAIRSVPLARNVGLPAALNQGLHHAKCELVARFDTDDLCEPDRFSTQLGFLAEHEDIAAVSGWVEEFDSKSGDVLALRAPPLTHAQLIRYAKMRSPMNHPAVMYRKSAVLRVGGYEDDVGFEDYSLWLRLILAGFKLANLPRVLVRMRAGSSQIDRRRGWAYASHERSFVRKFRRAGFFSWADSVAYIALHTPLRFLPRNMLNFLYQRRLRRR